MAADEIMKSLVVEQLEVDDLLVRTDMVLKCPAASGFIGETAGFEQLDDGMAIVDNSQTACTYIIPVLGLKDGDYISGFELRGGITSGGTTITVDASLKVLTAAAGSPTNATLGAMTQVSKTGNYKLVDGKTFTDYEVSSDLSFYILVTVTTGADAELELLGANVTVQQF